MPRKPHRCPSGGATGFSLEFGFFGPELFLSTGPPTRGTPPWHGLPDSAFGGFSESLSLYILEIHVSQMPAPEAPHLSSCWEGQSGHPMISSLTGNQEPFKNLICSSFLKQSN